MSTLGSVENSAAFMLSFWASMGTFLGGVLVVALVGIMGADPNSSNTSKLMGVLQSLSGGVMMFMTCFHLIPESVELIGSKETMIYFFLGVFAFGILEKVILPEHEEEKKPAKKKKVAVQGISSKDALKLYRTSLITFIAMALHNIPEGISVYLAALSNPKMVVNILIQGIKTGNGYIVT
jgi:zinc transporter, ZIP family